MDIDIIIGIVLIAVFLVVQLCFFIPTLRLTSRLRLLFPLWPSSSLATGTGTDAITSTIEVLSGYYFSEEFKDEVLAPINRYIEKNKTVAEYSVIKEMSARVSESIEEQISTLAPLPVNVGLIGTLIGIVIGVVGWQYDGGLTDIGSLRESDKWCRCCHGNHSDRINPIHSCVRYNKIRHS